MLLIGTACTDPPSQVVELSGRTMGTRYSIKLAHSPGPGQLAPLQQRIDDRLDAINRMMSTYREDSDLMRFNRTSSTTWQDAPAALVDLVERALRISESSDGMYDITVGPLVNLWGFGNAGDRNTPPSAGQIAELLPTVGYQHLQTRRAPPALRKTVAGLQADLSSIAKGWAVDEIAALLDAEGFTGYLVEIGGEVFARGGKRNGDPWRIAIERPSFTERSIQRVVALHDLAMATSGDYRNFFPAGGKRYSHTIDPRSGMAIAHGLASVTVFARNCAEADGWATALMALGDEQGPATAERLGIQALFIARKDDGFSERVSSALHKAPVWRGQP